MRFAVCGLQERHLAEQLYKTAHIPERLLTAAPYKAHMHENLGLQGKDCKIRHGGCQGAQQKAGGGATADQALDRGQLLRGMENVGSDSGVFKLLHDPLP